MQGGGREFSEAQLKQLRLAGYCIRGIVKALEQATGLTVVDLGLLEEGAFVCDDIDAGDGVSILVLRKKI